jgi:hypothetical protein
MVLESNGYGVREETWLAHDRNTPGVESISKDYGVIE